ncbi:MAG: hypothetical protein ABIC36_01345 [bacterium]
MESNKLKDSLKKIENIINWFDEQQEIDVEAGLEKVKQGVVLIKSSKERLKDLENEFKKVKSGLEKEINSDE